MHIRVPIRVRDSYKTVVLLMGANIGIRTRINGMAYG